ncbi:response regulator [Natronorubrum sp. FCH18a]|uniref:response regulator n=1 Tax=Natronorubrum sp. FCH18a TaxID=3447018 RepID=UPI003F51806F
MPWRNNARTATKHVLLIDPNTDDARRFRDAFETVDTVARLHVVATGDDAVGFVRRDGEHAESPRPDLVLLDPDLPDSGGYELLATLKDGSEPLSTPVIVLSRSESDDDIVRSYDLQANAYVLKPDGTDEFEQFVRLLERFWLGCVRLPTVT